MPNPLRRKLAISTWSAPKEGNIYGKLTVDATEAIAYLDHVREQTGERVTMTHLVGRVVAEALAREPSLNGRIRLGKFIPHETVDIAYLVAMEDGSDLAKAKIEQVDRKSVADIAGELRQRATRLRQGADDDWEKSKGVVKALPTFLLRPLLKFIGWLASSLGLEARGIGVERFPFGSAIVTSVGMFGVDEAFVPPTPFARVPLYVLIGAVRDQAVVEDGEVVARPILTVTATIDHRFVDGFQMGTIAREFHRIMGDPWALDHRPATPVADDDAADDDPAGDTPTEAVGA